MTISDVSFPDGTINAASAIEQTALMACLYHNDRISAQRIIDALGGGQILAWSFTPVTWPPDFLIFRQGRRIGIVLTGTTNYTQLLTHIVGAAAVPDPESDAFVHSLWLTATIILSNLIVPFLPRPLSDFNFVVSGHSYGGAVGLLIARAFVQQVGSANVQLFTIGQPKVWTKGYEGPLPLRYQRLVAENDFVPTLPPVNLSSVLAVRFALKKWFGFAFGFYHYGVQNNVYENGTLIVGRDTEQPDFPAPYDVYRTSGGAHSVAAYASSLKQFWALNSRAEPQSFIAALGVQVAYSPPVQDDHIALPQTTYINTDTANSVYFAPGSDILTPGNLDQTESVSISAGEVTLTSRRNIHDGEGNEMPSASGYWQFTAIINNGTYGTQTHVVYKGTSNASDAILKARSWVLARSNILGCDAANQGACRKSLSQPKIEFLRVSDALNPRIGQLITLSGNDYFGYAGTTTAAADVFSTALSVRLAGLNQRDNVTTAYSNHQSIGGPDDAVKAGVYNPSVVIGNARSYDALLGNYFQYLTNPLNNLGFIGLNTAQVKKDTEGWALNSRNRWQFTCTAHGYTTGDKVVVTSADSLGFNGLSRITVVDANTLYLNKKLSTLLIAPTFARVQRTILADGSKVGDFYLFQVPLGGWASPWNIKVSKKNLGKQFLAVSFKKRGRRVA